MLPGEEISYTTILGSVLIVSVFFWQILYMRAFNFKDNVARVIDEYLKDYSKLNAKISIMLASEHDNKTILDILNKCPVNLRVAKRVIDQLKIYRSDRQIFKMIIEYASYQLVLSFYFILPTPDLVRLLDIPFESGVLALSIGFTFFVSALVTLKYLGNLDRLNNIVRMVEKVKKLVETSVQQGKCSDELNDIKLIELLVVQHK